MYHYFPSKADLGAALARRYWEDAAAALESLSSRFPDPLEALSRYPALFREALIAGNRMCMCSFFHGRGVRRTAGPGAHEVQTFADVNIAWLAPILESASAVAPSDCESRSRAIYAAIAGAQLIARSRSDVSLYDALIGSYREAGLLPG